MSFSSRRTAFRQRFYSAKRRLYRRLGRNVRTVAVGFQFTARNRVRFDELTASLLRLTAALRRDYKAHRVAGSRPDFVISDDPRPARVCGRMLRTWYIAMKRSQMRRRLRQHRLRMRVHGRQLRGLTRPASLVGVDLGRGPDSTVFAHWRVHESGAVELLETWSEP